MRIEWSRHAYNSLADVLDYTLENFGVVQQNAIEDLVMHSIDLLVDFTKLSPVIPEISNNIGEYRKLVVTKEITVIYWLDFDVIHISFVWDVRRSF